MFANLGNLSSIDYRCNRVEDGEVVIGFITRQIIMKLFNEGSIDKHSLSKFYNSVRQFFTSAMDYLSMWCPLDEEILHHAVWIDFERKLDVTFNSMEYFVGCFPSILNDKDHDKLNEQFLQYNFSLIFQNL